MYAVSVDRHITHDIRSSAAATERLVDVRLDSNDILHTCPIAVDASGATAPDAVFEAGAVRTAAFAHPVPDRDLASLTARMHVDRSGVLSPSGDFQDV